MMYCEVDPLSSRFHYFSVESRIPADHPLRLVKKLADSALSTISAELDSLYAKTGRPSIPPERLLKAQLLIALYSVRSDRQFSWPGSATVAMPSWRTAAACVSICSSPTR